MILVIVLIIVVIYTAFSVYLASRVLASYPQKINVSADLVAPTHEDITVNGAQGAVLKGWFFPGTNGKLIILVTGIKQIRANVDYFGVDLARELNAQGYALIMYDSRGHGESTGNVTQGLLESQDVVAVANFAKQKGFLGKDIGIIGDSMGAISILMAADKLQDIGALVIDSSAARMKPIIANVLIQQNGVWPIFVPGTFMAMKYIYHVDVNQINPIDHVAMVPNRVFLFLQSNGDTTIPVNDARALLAKANPQSKLEIFYGGNHIETYKLHPEQYRKVVFPFLQQQLNK